MSTWSEYRARLEAVIGDVRERAAAAGLAVEADVDPAEALGPQAGWNWHITFTTGALDVDVMAAQDLGSFAIEDERGRLEIEVGLAEFPDALVARLTAEV